MFSLNVTNGISDLYTQSLYEHTVGHHVFIDLIQQQDRNQYDGLNLYFRPNFYVWRELHL